MKKKIITIILTSFLLSSCTLINEAKNQSESDESSFSIGESESNSEESISESESEEESESNIETESESESLDESESETETESDVDTTKQFTVYASNDFHGRILEESNYMGLEKFGTYLKQKSDEENALLLDQGDTWQGSIYSNYNYGNLINDVMTYARFDARTVGNHDFDWGIDKITINKNREYNGYTIPVLAANVYDYDFVNHIEGDIQQENIGQKNISYVLENGLKVGIVGVIGKEQITSIFSQYTKDICFKDHILTIKEEATKLRNDGCDFIIASCHAGEESLKGEQLEKYVDLVLCGHTHQSQSSVENGLHYYQFGCNGEEFGKISITYDANQKEITSINAETIDKYVINNEIDEIDPIIHQLVTDGVNACQSEASVVLASNVSGYFDKKEKSVNVMCKAILDYVNKCGINDVIFSYCNDARAYLPYNQWTYADLYSSFPFDNHVYIIEVTGNEIKNEVMEYNRVCRSSSFDGKISLNNKYKIACIDYLAFHTNSSRNFDYFPDNKGQYVSVLDIPYRLILKNWLIENGYNTGKLMKASDYDTSLTQFSSNFTIV